MELTDVNSFLKPQVSIAIVLKDNSSYVVSMEKRKNRSLRVNDGLVKRFLDFISDTNLQQGYGYYVLRGLPRKMLNSIHILRASRVTSGVEIDDNGFVTYDKGNKNED